MDEDKIDDRFRVLEAVWVMAAVFLTDESDLPASGFEVFLEQKAILGGGHNVIGFPVNDEDGDLCFRKGGSLVGGVGFVSQRLGFGFESVGVDAFFPGTTATFAGPLAAGPAFEIEHRSVAVDAADFFRVGESPVDDDQPAAAHSFQGDLIGQAELLRGEGIEVVPSLDCPGRAKQVFDIAVDQMEPVIEQGDVGLRFVTEEAGAPDPWFSFRGFFGCHHPATDIFHFDVVDFKPVPVTMLSGQTGCRCFAGLIGSNAQ